jgi:hypothetical protein
VIEKAVVSETGLSVTNFGTGLPFTEEVNLEELQWDTGCYFWKDRAN